MNIRLIEHRYLHKKTVDTKFCITKDTLIGKTVIITDPHSSNYNKIGILLISRFGNYAIQFNEIIENGHSCNGHCTYGYGQYFSKDAIKFIN